MNVGESVDRGGRFLAFLGERNVLDQASISRVRGAIAATRQPVDVVLLELGLLHESRLADHEAAFLGLDRVRSEEFPDEFDPETELPAEFLRRMELVPLRTTADRVVVATARPLRHAPQLTLIPGEKADNEVGLLQRISTQDENFADTCWHTWNFQSITVQKKGRPSEMGARLESGGFTKCAGNRANPSVGVL